MVVNEPSNWVLKMVSSIRHMVGVSCKGYEKELMDLFAALEKDRISLLTMTPSRLGGKMLKELKGLESIVNYDGNVSVSTKSRYMGWALVNV